MVGTKILMQTLRSSLTALIIPSYLLFMLVTFFGTILFAFEYDPYDYENGSRVQDVGSSWWMVLVTMTTVGYGDYSPQSTAGKLVMGFIMIVGVTIIAMPIAIVGNNFSRAWDERTLLLISQKTKMSLLNTGGSPVDVVKAFEKFDENGSGACSYEEFKHAVTQKLGLRLSGHRLRSMWRTLDTDESGQIKIREFAAAIFPDVEEHTLSACKDQLLGPNSTGQASSTQPGFSAQATTDTEQRLQMLEDATHALTSQQQALQQSIDKLIGLLESSSTKG